MLSIFSSWKLKRLTLIVLMVIVNALSGCSNPENGKVTGVSVIADSNSSQANTGQKNNVVELEFLQFFPITSAFDAVIAKFQEKYPHIKIKQTYLPDAAKVLEIRMLTGEAPDLFSIEANAAYRNYAKNQQIVDLSNESFMKRVNPEALEIIDFDGKKYGMPGAFNTMGIYFNKKIFTDLGITVPQTKSDLMTIADKLNTAGIMPFAFPDNDMPSINKLDFQGYTGVYTDIPKKIFWDAMDKKAHLTESEALHKAVQLYVDLRTYSENSADVSMEEALNQFASGKAAMLPSVSFASGKIKGVNPKLEFSIFPIPGDDPSKIRVPVGIGFQFVISSNSKHIEEAKLFLDFWSQTENASFFESLDLAPSAIINLPSSIKETELMRHYIDQGKTFQWPGEKYWSVSQINDFAAHSKILIQTKDVNHYFTAIDSFFYGMK